MKLMRRKNEFFSGMPVLPLLSYDDPLLRQPSLPVEPGEDVSALVQDLRDTLKAGKSSIGLAAPQVGVLKQVFVMRLDGKEPIAVINPALMWTSEGKPGGVSEQSEGCLSLPATTIKIIRPRAIKVVYQDETGQPHDEELDGIAARCWQHEYDHLGGKMITDHRPPEEQEAIYRALARRTRKADRKSAQLFKPAT
jgi:peptide deformylase